MTESKKIAALTATAFSTLMLAGVASAQVVSEITPSNDTFLRDGVGFGTTGVSDVLNSIVQRVPYIQFDMSSLNVDSISSASLTLTKAPNGDRNDTLVGGRVSLQGLPEIDGNTLQFWHETDSFVPGDDPATPPNGLDFRNVGLEWSATAPDGVDFTRLVNLDAETGAAVTETINGDNTVVTISGSALIDFLNTRADASGLVTFLLPFPDGTADNRGLGFQSKEAAIAPVLSLTYTQGVIPEPASLGLLGIAGLGLLRRRTA